MTADTLRMPSDTSSVAIVKSFFELLSKGEMQRGMDYIDDDFSIVEAASLPYGGTYRGKAGFIQLMGLLEATWEDFGFAVHHVFGSGERVAVIERIFGKARGTPFDMLIVEIWTVRGGKIVEVFPCYHDTGLLAAICRGDKA